MTNNGCTDGLPTECVVRKKCKNTKCGKIIYVNPENKTHICRFCGSVNQVTKTLGKSRNGDNKHGIRLWAVKA